MMILATVTNTVVCFANKFSSFVVWVPRPRAGGAVSPSPLDSVTRSAGGFGAVVFVIVGSLFAILLLVLYVVVGVVVLRLLEMMDVDDAV